MSQETMCSIEALAVFLGHYTNKITSKLTRIATEKTILKLNKS